MAFSWPWSSSGTRVKDMRPAELITMTMNQLRKSGRTAQAMRLIYRTLELDPYQPQALLTVSEMFRGNPNGRRPQGDEIFAGILIEFAMDRKSTITGDLKRNFDRSRLEILNSWGFVKERAGEFDVDHIGYMTFIHELMGKVQSLANGFKLVMAKLGVQGGVIDPATGKPTRQYKDWLNSEISSLPR